MQTSYDQSFKFQGKLNIQGFNMTAEKSTTDWLLSLERPEYKVGPCLPSGIWYSVCSDKDWSLYLDFLWTIRLMPNTYFSFRSLEFCYVLARSAYVTIKYLLLSLQWASLGRNIAFYFEGRVYFVWVLKGLPDSFRLHLSFLFWSRCASLLHHRSLNHEHNCDDK
jgi:hypothetical protein